jgi:hypothetical protein
LIGENGIVASKEASDFKRLASKYGLSPDDLGKEFVGVNGKKFKLLGCKPRSSKYPLVAEEVGSGKKFKLTTAAVCKGLGKPYAEQLFR